MSLCHREDKIRAIYPLWEHPGLGHPMQGMAQPLDGRRVLPWPPPPLSQALTGCWIQSPEPPYRAHGDLTSQARHGEGTRGLPSLPGPAIREA